MNFAKIKVETGHNKKGEIVMVKESNEYRAVVVLQSGKELNSVNLKDLKPISDSKILEYLNSKL